MEHVKFFMAEEGDKMAAEDLQLGKDHWFTLYKVSTTFTPACAFSQVVLPLAFSAKDYDHQR